VEPVLSSAGFRVGLMRRDKRLPPQASGDHGALATASGLVARMMAALAN
jgi:hypothetical protein